MTSLISVIADSLRNPGCAWHWIPDQVRDDNARHDLSTSHQYQSCSACACCWARVSAPGNHKR